MTKKGEWEEALADLNVASRQMPKNSEAAYGRGRCLHRLGRHPEAEAALRLSIVLNPEDPRTHNSLGRLLIETGRTEEGTSALAKARELHAKNRATRPGEVRYEADKAKKKP